MLGRLTLHHPQSGQGMRSVSPRRTCNAGHLNISVWWARNGALGDNKESNNNNIHFWLGSFVSTMGHNPPSAISLGLLGGNTTILRTFVFHLLAVDCVRST